MAADRQSATILLVANDVALIRTVEAFLRPAGYTVLTANDGLTAFGLLREMQKLPALLISDVELPGISGVDLAALITGVCPFCRVLLISGAAPPPEADGHGWTFRPKPVTREVLLSTVAAMLDVRPDAGCSSDCPEKSPKNDERVALREASSRPPAAPGGR